jgi:uncharacterized protein YggE
MSRISIVLSAALMAMLLLVGGLLAYLAPAIGRIPAPQLVAAQTAPPAPTVTPRAAAAANQREITVVADGEANARPDQAWISAGVEVTKPTAAEALAEANGATEAVLAKIDQLGISRTNVQTTGVSLYPMMDGGPRPQPNATPTITGYRAGNHLTVLVGDMGKVGQVLDALVSAGATNVGGVRFGLKDDSALRMQALEDALKSARPKAEAMAKGLGLTAGEVLIVREEGAYAPPMPLAQGAGAKAGDVPIEGGQLSVHMRVQVTFALTPTP